MRNKLLLLSTLLLLLQSCGGGSNGNTGSPTLTFIGSNLDQYGAYVPGNIKTIEIQIKENIAPQSVTKTNVHLMPGNNHIMGNLDISDGSEIDIPTNEESNTSGSMDAIEGNVWFEPATRTIKFEPSRPLSPGTTYHLRVQNVELADGRKVSVSTQADGTKTGIIEFNFTTYHVHEVLQIRYDQSGNETAYIAYEIVDNVRKARRQYNKNKKLTLLIEYNAPLPSPSTRIATLLYRDEENNITQYDHEVVENGVVIANVRYKDPGDDGLWGTDDDLAVTWSQRDQTHLSHTLTKIFALENLSQKVRWSGINTPDFKLRTAYLEEHAGKNFEHRNIFYRDLGANGDIDIDPNTQELTIIDDYISLWYKRDFSAGKRIRSWSIGGTSRDGKVGGEGSDARLFTDDDIATGLTTYEYYPQDGSLLAGQLKKTIGYYGTDFSHPLNQWMTDYTSNIVRSDAPVHSYNTYVYDNFGNRLEDIGYSPGPDGIMASESEFASGNSDDYITKWVSYSTLPTVKGGQELGLQ